MVKTIQVEDETWEKLTILKAKKRALSLDEIIRGLINNV